MLFASRAIFSFGNFKYATQDETTCFPVPRATLPRDTANHARRLNLYDLPDGDVALHGLTGTRPS